MHSSLKISCLFNCCDGGSNTNTVKTKENSICILEASLLYFKVMSHVILMWYREYIN